MTNFVRFTYKSGKIAGLFFLFLTVFSPYSSAQTSPKIYINEFLASNLTTNPEMVDFGGFSDWIELYNDEESSVNVSGMYLSDDFTVPMKWQIPLGTIIPAKGYFLVWADDFNDVPGKIYIRNWWPNHIQFTTQWCHTNFKLGNKNEQIGLFDVSGNIVDTVSYSSQMTDVSFGRKPNGGTEWQYFGEPTPLASNSTPGLKKPEISGNVIFSVEGGFYQNEIQVSLSSESGNGIIRYTTDGSKPLSSSTQYSNSISVTKNTILRARVFEENKVEGAIVTNSYFINEVQHLPVVSFATDPKLLWDKKLGIYLNSLKEREIPVSLEFFPVNSTRAFTMDAGARIGGENIFRFAQKPLNIYARSDYGFSHIAYKIFEDVPFLEYKQLYLRNSGSDWTSTMFRDGMLVTALKNRIVNSMQNYRPAVMYLNGVYWGINNIREKVDDQYFYLHYNIDPSDLDHLEDTNKIITGDSTDFVNLMSLAAVSNLSDSATYDYFASRVNVHDLMDFVITQDFIANSSWGHNRETWRDRKGEKKWRWALVDMDRGIDAARISSNQLDDFFNNFPFFKKMCENTNFKNEFIQRYSEHLNKTFNQTRMFGYIDSIKALLTDEIPRHSQKWGTYIDSLSINDWGNDFSVPSISAWNANVQKFKDYITQRPTYAVQYLSTRFGLNGRANLTISSNVPNQGKISVMGYDSKEGECNLYFKNVPVTIHVFPPPGYAFKQWKGTLSNSTEFTIIPAASTWKYRDESTAPDATWKNTDFNDAGWKSGGAQLGYGDGDEKTVIGYGADGNNKYITSYFRNSFSVTDPANIKSLTLKLLRDDGAVVYLNGSEVTRSNMPTGTITNSTLATSAVSGTDESTFFEFALDITKLIAGKNVLSVEIHQSGGTSSDVSFDASLKAVLIQSSPVEVVLGTDPILNYSFSGDTELKAEYEQISSNDIPQNISTSLNLTKASSPYYVKNDITVEENGILTAEPGTKIYFTKDKSIYVKGKLLLEGTREDRILLTSYFPGETWGAVCFDSSKGTSVLNNIELSNASNGNDAVNFFAAVSSYKSSVEVRNVHFNYVKSPISTQWSDMIIDSCLFENIMELQDHVNCNGGNLTITNSIFNGNAVVDMDAVDLGFNTGITKIQHNIFRDFTGSNSDGIDLGDNSRNVIIEDNLFSNIADKGISIGQGSQAFVTRNAIMNCDLGIGVKDSNSHVDVLNTTFYKNRIGIACYEKVLNRGGGSATVKNSIFANSKLSSITTDNLSAVSIDYSLSNSDTLIGNNNLFADPLFINPDGADFHIQAFSSCINSGDPSSTNDADGSRADIGIYPYSGVGLPNIVINEINYNSASSFDSDDWVELYNTTKNTIDLSNYVFMDDNRTPSFVFPSGTQLNSNDFFVLYKSASLFSAKYPSLVNNIGNMTSGLSGSGEILFLYDNAGRLLDSLTYDDAAPWPVKADGNGSSLELTNPALENSVGENWKASIGHGTPGAVNSTFYVGVENSDNTIPFEFSLSQNYPNPFNPSTIVRYTIKNSGKVTLSVYDLLGRKISVIVDKLQKPGQYEIEWNAGSFGSGIYFYRLQSGNYSAVKKMLLVR